MERLDRVRERIGEACSRAGREPGEVELIAVSKTHPAETVREMIGAGHTLFGENRIQEAVSKIAEVGPPARWHMIGHLQRNKAKQAAGAFELIHSVDNEPLAAELDKRAAAREIVQPVLLQVNQGGEESKSGIPASGLERLAEAVLEHDHLDLQGLMTIPPWGTEPEESRRWFAELRDLRDRLREAIGRPLGELSMGMTDDFEVAVEEGATLIRVGRALFGPRLPRS